MSSPLKLDANRYHPGQFAGVPEGLNAILDTLDDCVFVVALPEWQCTYANDASRAVFGWPAQELLADITRWINVVHPDDRAYIDEQLRRLFEEGRADCEYRVVHPDGKTLVVHSRTRLRKSAEGRPISFDCTTRDVTEQAHAREARAHDGARFRAVIDASPVPMALNDEALNITYLNPAFIATFGYGLDDIPHLDRWWPLAYPDPGVPGVGQIDVGERLEDARSRQGAFEPLEIRIRCKDGTDRVASVAAAALGASFSGTHLVVLHDVTRQRQAHEELAAAREAAVEASRIKSRFLANMSHELRTPLNGVLGLTGLALASAQSDEQRTLLRSAHESGLLLLTILGDILDLSKIEAGRLEIERVPFDLRQVVSESARVVRLAAEAKGVALLCNVEPEFSSWVYGDAIRVRQILHNLCANAVKFTNRGHVSLNVGRDASDGQVWIRVEDTGCGIDPGRLELIFDAFTQADGSTTRSFGGTGLGLAICRELAGLMDGRIWAESTPGNGSTFHVRLPLPPAESPAPGAGPPVHFADPRRASAPLRVLLAEDNPINALVARHLLERMGHVVTHVPDGVQTLEVLGDGSGFDVVLMDVQMPLLDGLDTTRAIRSRGLQIPVVALTANAMQGDAEVCLAAGMDDYLPKPIEQERLRAALERLASRKKPR